MTDPRRAQGARYEAAARAHLEAHGLECVMTNFRSRFGELDLVMRDRGTLVVVEVRSRAPSRMGTAAETVGPAKRRRIVRTTQFLLASHPDLARLPLRFDVVAIDTGPVRDQLRWLRGAFDSNP